MDADVIAMFELGIQEDKVKIIEERQLVSWCLLRKSRRKI